MAFSAAINTNTSPHPLHTISCMAKVQKKTTKNRERHLKTAFGFNKRTPRHGIQCLDVFAYNIYKIELGQWRGRGRGLHGSKLFAQNIKYAFQGYNYKSETPKKPHSSTETRNTTRTSASASMSTRTRARTSKLLQLLILIVQLMLKF